MFGSKVAACVFDMGEREPWMYYSARVGVLRPQASPGDPATRTYREALRRKLDQPMLTVDDTDIRRDGRAQAG